MARIYTITYNKVNPLVGTHLLIDSRNVFTTEQLEVRTITLQSLLYLIMHESWGYLNLCIQKKSIICLPW